jgi:hypothetical protein
MREERREKREERREKREEKRSEREEREVKRIGVGTIFVEFNDNGALC